MFGDHGVEFPWHAWQAGDGRLTDAKREPGSGAGGVAQRTGAHRDEGLASIGGQESTPQSLVTPRQPRLKVRIQGQLDARRVGHGVAGAVVIRRAQAAADDDHTARVAQAGDRLDHGQAAIGDDLGPIQLQATPAEVTG